MSASKPDREAGSAPAVTRRGWLPLILVVASGLVYPLVFSFAKLAADAGAPPLGFVLWQLGFTFIGLAVIGLIRRDLPGRSLAHIRSYFVLALIGVVGPISLLTFLSARLPAGIITLVVVLSPLLTYVFAILARLDRLRALSVAGIALGLAGVLLVSVPKVSLPTPDMVGWLLLAFLAPVFFAMVNVTASLIRPPAATSVSMATGMVGAAALMMTVIALATGQAYALPGPWPALPVALGTAVVNIAFYIAFFEVVRLAGPVFFSQFNYLVVLAGFGWGALIFGEAPSVYVWGSAVLMLLGLALHSISLHRAAQAARMEPRGNQA